MNIVYCQRCEGFYLAEQVTHHKEARADICENCHAEVNDLVADLLMKVSP